MNSFYLLYSLLLVTGPVTICGWYAITRGRVEFSADGNPYKTGKLLKAWHFFWTKHDVILKEVHGQPLIDIYLKLHDKFPDLFMGEVAKLIRFDTVANEKKQLELIRKYHIIKNIAAASPKIELEGKIYFFREEKIYRFPVWLRDWVSECPTCAASFYGSLYYWSVVIAMGFNKCFSWSDVPVFSALFFWAAFCFASAFVNTILAKKL